MRTGSALQLDAAEIDAVDDSLGGRREEELAAVGGVTDAERANEAEPDVAGPPALRLAGVHADADTERGCVRPLGRVEDVACGDRREEGVAGAPEDGDERVADHLERLAVVRRDRVLDDLVVALEHCAVPGGAERPEHGHRSHEVCDEERDGSCREARCLGLARELGHGAERCERRAEPIGEDLVDPLGAVEPFEEMLAEVAELEPRALVLVDEARGRAREEYLPSMPDRADARGTMDAHPEVAGGRHLGLGGVDPHPDPNLPGIAPLLGRVGTLRIDGRRDAVLCAAERDEEALPLRVHLVPVMRCDRIADELGVPGEDVAVVATERTDETRRSLHVREEEGHRALGPLAHVATGHRCTTI